MRVCVRLWNPKITWKARVSFSSDHENTNHNPSTALIVGIYSFKTDEGAYFSLRRRYFSDPNASLAKCTSKRTRHRRASPLSKSKNSKRRDSLPLPFFFFYATVSFRLSPGNYAVFNRKGGTKKERHTKHAIQYLATARTTRGFDSNWTASGKTAWFVRYWSKDIAGETRVIWNLNSNKIDYL